MDFIVEKGNPIDDQKVHRAELVDVKPGTSESYGDYLRFLFRLVDDPDHSLVSGICPAQLIIGNKFYSWLCVLNGSNLEIGVQIDPNDYIGKVVELTVKNINDGDRVYANVDSLVRLINSNDQSSDQEVSNG
jgi:hypothetical protein